MHLKVVDGNGPRLRTPPKGKAKVIHRNNDLPEGLWLDISLRVKLQPPAWDDSPANDAFEIVEMARDFYEELPLSLRHMDPFDGTFTVLDKGFLGGPMAEPTFARGFVELQMFKTMDYHRERNDFYEAVRAAEAAIYKFNTPWGTKDWKVRWGVQIAMQPDKVCPEWVLQFCNKWNITVKTATAWPVEAYA